MQKVFALMVSLLTATSFAESNRDSPSPGSERLVLPENVPALAGLETNIYFENTVLLLEGSPRTVNVVCDKGMQQSERWTWVPQENDTGNHAIRVEFRDQENRITSHGSSTIRVRSRKLSTVPPRPVTILMIGDSLTGASIYPRHVYGLAVEDGLPLRLIGSCHAEDTGHEPPPAVRHEGYGGWTAKRFATHFTGVAREGPPKERGSPFLFEDKSGPVLDFERYCQKMNGGSAPDFVTIFLGCNDIFHATDDNIEEKIDEMFLHYGRLVDMLHAFDPAIKIGVILPIPPAATQDAFGANYGCGQTRWQYRRNQHRLLERMLAAFGGKESQNIFIVPAWLNLDTTVGFPSSKVPIHARSTTQVTRSANAVHPSADGYRQLGDSIYAWLRSFDTDTMSR